VDIMDIILGSAVERPKLRQFGEHFVTIHRATRIRMRTDRSAKLCLHPKDCRRSSAMSAWYSANGFSLSICNLESRTLRDDSLSSRLVILLKRQMTFQLKSRTRSRGL
jgi:hypothetical protein